MDFLHQLMEAVQETESIAFLSFMFGAFAIGFFTARLMWGAKARRHYEQAQNLEKELHILQATRNEDAEKLASELKLAQQKIQDLKARPATTSVPLASEQDAAQWNRLHSIEEKLNRIEAENARLKANLETLRENPEVALPPVVEPPLDISLDDELIPPPATQTNEDDQEIDEAQQKARAQILAAIGTVIPRAEAHEKDNLQQIEGIGPFLEAQLNELGIQSYRQIAALDELLIPTLTTAIAFFPGRIDRDDWVGQARELMGSIEN